MENLVGMNGLNADSVVTLFWRRLREDMSEEDQRVYDEDLAYLNELSQTSPGFAGIKRYVSEDGESLTVVIFDSAEDLKGWATNPEHTTIQERGRERYYAEYRIAMLEAKRTHGWSLDEGWQEKG